MPTDMATAAADKLPEAAEAMDFHAIRRIATLEEVAATVVCFLESSDAGYISLRRLIMRCIGTLQFGRLSFQGYLRPVSLVVRHRG
jgi:NAD(P)-dependent dehydrogenase (short-subunit alcohol dehydrogenase family)